MDLPLVYILTIAIMASSGLLMALGMLGSARLSPDQKLHHGKQNPPIMRGAALTRSAIVNSVLSTGMYLAFVILAADRLFYTTPDPVWRIVLDALMTLLLYDLLYYWLHRHAFHGWQPLRKVHSVHHRGKYPTAIDSLYIHPIETFLGIAVAIVCVVLVGPMHVYAFALWFLAYTHANIIVHWGLKLRMFPLSVLCWMSEKHDIHHKSMQSGNYASITPLPDMLFGTLSSPAKPPSLTCLEK